MENLHFGRIVNISLLLLFLFACSGENKRSADAINGHWYVIYGDSIKMYGEVIYENDHFCSYSDEFGLVYREFKIKSDTILEIYNRGTLDHKRIIFYMDSSVMLQTLVSTELKPRKSIGYHRITSSDISYQKIFEGDPSEQSRYIDGFLIRKALWQKE